MMCVLAMVANAEIAPQGGVLQLDQTEEGVAHLVVTDQVVSDLAPGVVVPGRRHRQVWQISEASQTSLQLTETLIVEAEAEGLVQRYRCNNDACGGFDFRLQAPITPPPTMFVNLADYHFAALHDADETRWVTLLVSRSGTVLFVEVTEIIASGVAQPNLPPAAALVGDKIETLDDEPPAEAVAPMEPVVPVTAGDVAQAFQTYGHFAISGLNFASGSGTLAPEAEVSLAAIAAFLNADRARRIALVGHSDATGGFEVNQRLSRQRAAQTRDRLIEVYDVVPSQVAAFGAAWLAPLRTNVTEQGRAINRRVEAVLLAPLPE